MSIEDFLVSLPPWTVPRVVAEFGSRTVAMVLRLTGHPLADGAEARARGVFSAPRLKAKGLRIGRNIEMQGPDRVTLNDGVCLYGDVFLGAVSEEHEIAIGHRTQVDRNVVLYGGGGIRIGHDCAIAAGVIVYSQSNQYRSEPLQPILDQPVVRRQVVIGDYVWVGAGAIILPGTVIGDHAVVAAGAVVTTSVEPWKVVAGVPAKVIADRRTVT